MNTQTLWQIVLSDMELQVSKAVFQTFFSQTRLLELTDKEAVIGCGQPLAINYLEKSYLPLIKKTLETYTKTDTRLILKSIPLQPRKNLEGPLFTSLRSPPLPSPPSIRLNPDYTFENFAVSSSNQMAYAAATAVAKTPGVSYNPLFLYGGTGVGKTHLMQGVAHQILKNKIQTKIIYATGEEFTNGIIEAIGSKTTVAFKKKYRHVNVLLIDDIQFIAGKNAVQEEFFHTFNSIQQVGGQIVLTSDRTPEEIEKLSERLRSRFEGGLTIDIGPPDFELRCAIVLIKAKQRGVEIPIELAKIMAANTENPRKLEGVLIRVLTESQTRKIPLDQDLVEAVLGKTIKETPRKNNVKPDEVVSVVASYFNIKISQLKSSRRDRSLSVPRQILYYILRSELNLPLMEIGRLLGGRDHTTILHGIRKVSEMIDINKKTHEDVLGIKNKLFGYV